MLISALSLYFVIIGNAFGNSASEKWSWPESQKDKNFLADSRRDVYYENVNNGKNERIRVPTSYDTNNRRPFQAYQASVANKPKPLSDEFSDESGENYNNNNNNINGGYSNNRPNRFGSQTQQTDDFAFGNGIGPQFGQQPGGFGPVPFPGVNQNHGVGGGIFPGYGGYGQNGPFQGFGHGGIGPQGFHQGIGQGHGFTGGLSPNFGGHGAYNPRIPFNNIANGILVGPGGPTGIIGRPYNNNFHGNNFHGNNLGGNFLPGAGGFGHGNPGIGGGFPPQPFFDSANNNNNNKSSNVKRVEKSAD